MAFSEGRSLVELGSFGELHAARAERARLLEHGRVDLVAPALLNLRERAPDGPGVELQLSGRECALQPGSGPLMPES